MARYIDADKAEKEFEETFCKHCNSYDGAKCRACDMKDSADIFNDALTEDVQTVKHGKWRFSGNYSPTKNWICSECNGMVTMPVYCWENYYNYCPNCGAKMGGNKAE